MAINAGTDRAMFRPLRPDGNYTKGSVGCHRGHMEYLNVPNPQPNRHYYWTTTDPKSINRVKAQGWNFVTKDDPEWSGNQRYDDVIAANLDTTVVRNEIALCLMPLDRYRDRQAALVARQDRQRGVESASAEYLDKGKRLEATFGRDVYFKERGHGIRHSES